MIKQQPDYIYQNLYNYEQGMNLGQVVESDQKNKQKLEELQSNIRNNKMAIKFKMYADIY